MDSDRSMNSSEPAQQEALLNELKGNLLEFLVASKLAQHFGIEGAFLSQIPGPDLQRLMDYEEWLKARDSYLFSQLPLLADFALENLLPSLHFSPKSIQILGKSTAISGFRAWEEADLFIKGATEREIFPLSLKLCRNNSYVNTKSGGIKSFLTKYFLGFEVIEEMQSKLNRLVMGEFEKMRVGLFKLNLLADDPTWRSWVAAGKSELPGQLAAPEKEIVHAFYATTNSFLKKCLQQLYQENEDLFITCLLPLLGAGHPQLTQLIVLYENEKDKKYIPRAGLIFSNQDLRREIADIHFQEGGSQGLSSFELQLQNRVLQIRCKPMNKFTTPALKINCSIKCHAP